MPLQCSGQHGRLRCKHPTINVADRQWREKGGTEGGKRGGRGLGGPLGSLISRGALDRRGIKKFGPVLNISLCWAVHCECCISVCVCVWRERDRVCVCVCVCVCVARACVRVWYFHEIFTFVFLLVIFFFPLKFNVCIYDCGCM